MDDKRCGETHDLMMRYMDHAITAGERTRLDEHMALCNPCREDFETYARMLAEFARMELVEAPEGFETAVMARIELLPAIYDGGDSRVDTLICMVWGSFSVLSGAGMLLVVNKDGILSWAESDPKLAAYVEALTPVSEAAADFIARFAQLVSTCLETFGAYADSIQLVLAGVFSALALAQFFVYRKDKVKAS